MERERSQRRRVVLHPRTSAARRFNRSASETAHVRGHSVETAEVMALVRQQFRTSLVYAAVIVTPLMVYLVAIALFPEVRSARPLGPIPLPWLVVGPGTLFTLIGLAFHHDRVSLRTEEEWSERHEVSGQ